MSLSLSLTLSLSLSLSIAVSTFTCVCLCVWPYHFHLSVPVILAEACYLALYNCVVVGEWTKKSTLRVSDHWTLKQISILSLPTIAQIWFDSLRACQNLRLRLHLRGVQFQRVHLKFFLKFASQAWPSPFKHGLHLLSSIIRTILKNESWSHAG